MNTNDGRILNLDTATDALSWEEEPAPEKQSSSSLVSASIGPALFDSYSMSRLFAAHLPPATPSKSILRNCLVDD